MSRINWVYVIVFGIVALLVVLIGVSLLGRTYGGWSYGMMGPSMMGPGMMNWGFAPFGWLGMIFMWLIPLAFLALLVAGVVWLVRAIGGQGGAYPQSSLRQAQDTAATGTCPACGQPIQSNWRNCPFCGETLI
jgi:hypothetical protein